MDPTLQVCLFIISLFKKSLVDERLVWPSDKSKNRIKIEN